MSAPTILQTFLGGLGLSLSVHCFLRWNGRVFGVSGFVHRAIRGAKEELASVAGLLLGGCLVGLIEGHGPESLPIRPLRVILAGLLVGSGTKMGNGCTSGHMVCGVSRFSRRSIIATGTFTLTGAITTHLLHNDLTPPSPSLDWSMGQNGMLFLLLQLIPLIPLYLAPPSAISSPLKRKLAALTTSTTFAFALHLAQLTSAQKVLGFLLLPFHRAFDPTLIFFAFSVFPATMILYHYFRGDKAPKFGGSWQVPQNKQIDTRLVVGAALFGIGWGLTGACPAPAIINFGRCLTTGCDIRQSALWIVSMVLGGYLV